MAILDHVQNAFNRLIAQYKEAETVKGYLESVLSEAQEVENMFCDLITKRSISTAEGAMLDIIGIIVGQSRIIPNVVPLAYFAFSDYPAALPFEDLNNPGGGGQFYSLGDPLTGTLALGDDTYKTFIRARIAKNYTRATREDIIESVRFVFNVDSVIISEGDRAYLVIIGRTLTPTEQLLVTESGLLPKPLGIRASYGMSEGADAFVFGDLNNPGPTGKGFEDLNNPGNGGIFATLI